MNTLSTKRVAIRTLGCKVNQYDSALLEDCFKKENVTIVSDSQVADIYVVNSCTVTSKADQEAKHLLRRFHRQNPLASLVITGCYAQTSAQELKTLPNVHYVVGNTLKNKIIDLLKENPKPEETSVHVENPFKTSQALPTMTMVHPAAHRTRIFFKIQDGCDDFCTFCIIPYARGKNRSLDASFIIHQINQWVNDGVKEVVLTGVSLGSYGLDLNPKMNLAKVVERIEKETDLLRLRISSLEPEDVGDELLDVLKGSKKFCPHFHLPIQSGDDEILSRMKRNYDSIYYENLLTQIHQMFPDVFIGIDVICGFPGESPSQFQNTFELLQKLHWSKLHVFPYSPRKGTAAYHYPNTLSRADILNRSAILQKLSVDRYIDYLDRSIGTPYRCLVEISNSDRPGYFKAVSRNYLPIYFKAEDLSYLNQEVYLSAYARDEENLMGTVIDPGVELMYNDVSYAQEKTLI